MDDAPRYTDLPAEMRQGWHYAPTESIKKRWRKEFPNGQNIRVFVSDNPKYRELGWRIRTRQLQASGGFHADSPEQAMRLCEVIDRIWNG